MKKFLLLFISILYTSITLAEPSPFGLEIKKTTYEETRKKYSGIDKGINAYSDGKMYEINRSNINMEGIQFVLTIFDREDKLVAVLTKFNKTRYDALFKYLNQRYKLISSKDPFVGDKYAEFKNDNTDITISAPHMGFDLILNYIHKDLGDTYEKRYVEEKKQKEQEEMGNL